MTADDNPVVLRHRDGDADAETCVQENRTQVRDQQQTDEPAAHPADAVCPCINWCGDIRIRHGHHIRCDGRGGWVERPRFVEVDSDGWCVCEMHQKWKREATG